MVPPETTRIVREALHALGVERLTLAIHDASFPADPQEDMGRGSPYTAAGHRLLAFAASLGFTGIQLGPQGQTSASNPSPYDGALFSRDPMDVALAPLADDPAWAGVLSRDVLERLVQETPAGRGVRHAWAYEARRTALARAFASFQRNEGRLEERRRDLAVFERISGPWLDADALFEALVAEHGTDDWARWPSGGPADLDRRLLAPRHGEEERAAGRRRALRSRHAGVVALHGFAQYVLAEQHAALRALAGRLGLRLYGDLQVGLSPRDAWSRQALFLPDYLMGAPPSRTNPEGQAWGYAVLDPDQYDAPDGSPGPARRFVMERLDRMLTDFHGLRIDHPHGMVTPWVYAAGTADPLDAVRSGARLFASPDLADHPRLARWAIPRPDQIDRSQPRHADHWIRELAPEQVERFGVLLETALERARAHGRDEGDVICEVLSTWPYPLDACMARHGLGRFFVTQKADPDDRLDPYRTARATGPDWVMVGTHDTASLWSLVHGWRDTSRAGRWAAYLAERLEPGPDRRADLAERLAGDPTALAEAMFADLFVGPARNVMMFFADLFGTLERYNTPGTVGPHNWSVRVPADFETTWRDRARRGAAFHPGRALAMALRARAGPDEPRYEALAARLEDAAW